MQYHVLAKTASYKYKVMCGEIQGNMWGFGNNVLLEEQKRKNIYLLVVSHSSILPMLTQIYRAIKKPPLNGYTSLLGKGL